MFTNWFLIRKILQVVTKDFGKVKVRRGMSLEALFLRL